MVHSLCSMLACSGLEKSRKKHVGGWLKKPHFGSFSAGHLLPQFCDIPQTKKAKKLSIKGTLEWSIHFVEYPPAAGWKNHGKSAWEGKSPKHVGVVEKPHFGSFSASHCSHSFCSISQTKKAKKLSIKGTLEWSIHFAQCLPAAAWKNHGKSTWEWLKSPTLGLFQPALAPTVLRYSPNKKGQKTQHKRHSRMVHSLCGIPARSRLEKSWKKRLGGQKSQARGSG